MILAARCSIRGIQPELVFALLLCERAIDWLGTQIVVTSVTEGIHSPKSLHYVGFAADFVIDPNHLSSDPDIEEITRSFFHALSTEFDVVHYPGTLRWHIEFQPKRGVSLEKVMKR